MRPLSYPHTSCFLLCFSISSPRSLVSIKERWIPEIRHYCPDAPILLCGTKVDLRHDNAIIEKLASMNMKPISKEQGEECAKDIGAIAYIETSSLQNFNLVKCFELVVAASHVNEDNETLANNQSLSGKCSIQ